MLNLLRELFFSYFDEDNGDLYEGTVSDFATTIYRTFEPKNEDTDASLAQSFAKRCSRKHFQSRIYTQIILMSMPLTFWALENILNHWDGYAETK